MKNTWAIQSHSSLITPGWAVGWYFIPLFSLWKPVAAVQQMRDAAFGGSQGLNLTPWWLTWVLTCIIDRMSFRMPTETISEIRASALFDAATSPIGILSAIFAILMIKKLTNKQYQIAMGEA